MPHAPDLLFHETLSGPRALGSRDPEHRTHHSRTTRLSLHTTIRIDSMEDFLLDPEQEIETPVLLVTGENNHVFTDSNIFCYQRLESLAPDRHSLELIPGYGHQDVFMGKDCARDVLGLVYAPDSGHGASRGCMRLRGLAVVLLLSGCQQSSPPGPADVLERAPSTGQEPGARPLPPDAPGEPQPSEPQPSEPQPSEPQPSEPQPSEPQPSEAQSAPADELPEQTWSARSADGNAEVQQTALRNGKASRCTSTSTWSSPWDDQKVMWKWDTCIATREQLKFVSPDGKRVLVIDPAPASLQARGDWRDVEVATLYEHGVRVRGAKAGALLRAPVEVREPALRIIWVKGHGGFPGEPPRYTSDGKAIELETVDGHPFRLGFDGEGFPAAPEEKHVFTASTGMYQYEDEKKTVHFVGSLSEVPDPYRSRARPVDAQVLTMSGPLGLGAQPPPKPKPQSPLETGKDPTPQEALEKARIASPAELLDKARDTVKTLEEAQRIREQLVDAQLSESSSHAGGEPPASGSPPPPDADKDPSPTGPLEKARIPTPEELLERAREAVKKAEESQRTREQVMDEKPLGPQR